MNAVAGVHSRTLLSASTSNNYNKSMIKYLKCFFSLLNLYLSLNVERMVWHAFNVGSTVFEHKCVFA